ncbi:MAG: MATE family efflux transporter, partial [Clostridia bacterium]
MQRLQTLFAPRDLTQGSPMAGIAMFSLPLLLGNLAQQLYNTVDAIVVGQYIGDAALGAVGLAGPILNLMIVLFMGISTGATIVVSQFFGAKNREQLSLSIGTTVLLTLWSSLGMSVVGMICSRPLLLLLGTPESMLDMAADYLFIIMLGMTGCAFYSILSGVLRGLGDSTSPLIYLLIASVLNIVLDIGFVTLLGMKTDGVAWATIISQTVSAVLCYRKLCKMKDTLDLNRKTLHIDRAIMSRI